MTDSQHQWSWDASVEFVASKGYSEHCRTGSAPRSDHGTLHFFKRPDDPVNENGNPLEYAAVMLKDGRWLVSFFEMRRRDRPFLRIVGGTDYGD